MKKIKIAVISILAIMIISIIPFLLNQNPAEPETLPDNYVTRVIDGDTIELASGDTIRLLCIDTPEEGKEGYEEAKSFLEDLVLYEEVILESDTQDQDIYNRSLRYVYLNDSENLIFVNREIFKEGHAVMMIIEPSTARCDEVNS